MDVAQLVRLPNGDKVVMGSTPTFHKGYLVRFEVEMGFIKKLGFY